MYKYKMFLDKDKETEWLNKLAKEGLYATSFFAGFWTFEEGAPNEYTYQIDFGDKFGSVSSDYKEFMDESNIEIVFNWGFWVALRKKTSLGEFNLYTDVDSQIEHYKKILLMFKCVTIFELVILLIEILLLSLNGFSAAGLAPITVILAIVLAFVNITIRTANTVDELIERKTGIANQKKKNVSPLIPSGLLLNSCGLLMQDSVSEPLVRIVQILALIFMFTGIFITCKKRKENA